jgi:hypothetical protein
LGSLRSASEAAPPRSAIAMFEMDHAIFP